MVATMQQEKVLRKQVLFVIHGYEDNIDTPWLYEMSDALLAVDDFTVIVTGWGKGADFWVNYGQAASNTQTVSAAVAQIAQKLRGEDELYDLEPQRISDPVIEAASPYLYCIGHSLGAHVCGQAGNDFKFNRISGLDPAGPGFQYCPLNPGLTNSSADCVDVLHTNGESYDGFGRLDPLGHIDFYPSCGKTQPGCMRIEVGCSHDKAIYDFIGTINASMSDPFAYPVGEGPCDDDFIDNCQPCNDYTCPSAEPTCGNNQQPVGFLSACSNTRQLPCGSLAREEYFGKWFVPVTKSGFDMFCTRSSRVRS